MGFMIIPTSDSRVTNNFTGIHICMIITKNMQFIKDCLYWADVAHLSNLWSFCYEVSIFSVFQDNKEELFMKSIVHH